MHKAYFSAFAVIATFAGGLDDMACAQPMKPVAAGGCEACHGINGDSKRADVPRLNGQQSAYVIAKLREFQDPALGPPHAHQMMGRTAASFDDVDAAALAEYFSRQTPTQLTGKAPLAQAGRKIFTEGAGPLIPGPLIPPCGTCHGQNGEGKGEVPRIAGQHSQYLNTQLLAFKNGIRVGTPMNVHAWAMTQVQIQALTDYLSND